MAQGLHRFEAAGSPGRDQAGEQTDEEGTAANDRDVLRDDHGGEFGEHINFFREEFEAGELVHDAEKFIAVNDGEHAEPITNDDAHDPDEETLGEEDAHDLGIGSPETLEHADFASFLDDERDEGAGDAEGGHDHDEKEQVEHDVLLDHERAEHGGIFLHPTGEIKVGRKERGKLFADFIDLVGIFNIHVEAVDIFIEIGEVLSVGQRRENEGGVVFVVAHVKQAGDFEILREDRFIIARAAAFFHALEVGGRVDGDMITHGDIKIISGADADENAVAFEIEFALNNAGGKAGEVFFMDGIDTANVLGEDGRLGDLGLRFEQGLGDDVGSDAGDFGVFANFLDILFVVAHGSTAQHANADMGIETEDAVAQFAVEPGHDTDDDDEDGHAEGDADDGDESDDRNKGAFRPQIAERQEQFEWQARHPGGQVNVRECGCSSFPPTRTSWRGRELEFLIKIHPKKGGFCAVFEDEFDFVLTRSG